MLDSLELTGATILVVDDDFGIREIVTERLQYAGYQMLKAASGEEALQVLDRSPDVALVVTDIRMPGMSGLELADRITDLRRGLKLILMSGYFQPQALGVRFLKKPFTLTELEAAVQAELAS